MDTSALARLGLHPNDLKVFTAIAELGKTKTGAIMEYTGVGSSQTYLSLGRLVKRGLVSYQVRNNVRYYQAEIPDELIGEARQNVAQLEQLSESIVRAPHVVERNYINTYEGRDGFNKAFLRFMESADEHERILITGFTHSVPHLRELRSFLYRYNMLAEAKHCTMQMVMDTKFRHSLEERTGKAYVVRFLSSRYFTPCATSVSKSEVLLSVWGDHPLAISINEPATVESFRKNFELLWASAKPKE